MKVATFREGVVFAFLASLIGSIGFFAMSSLFPEDLAIHLLISGLAFCYVLYLLSRSQERVGRITTVLSWIILLVILWVSYPSITLFLILHVLAIWLIRSLYFYTSLVSSLVDFGMNVFSVAAGFWACHHTGSVFLSIWCFFLAQALFVAIPAGKKQPIHLKATGLNHEDDFNRAYQTAEAAVRKLSSIN